MNPRVSRSLGAGLEGDRIPHRPGRREARGRIHPRRARQRDHRRGDPGVVRALDRLRRRQDPAVRLREVSPGRFPADHPDEVRGRSDGGGPYLSGIPAEGVAQPGDGVCRARRDRGRPRSSPDARPRPARAEGTRSGAAALPRRCAAPRHGPRRSAPPVPDRSLVHRPDRGSPARGARPSPRSISTGSTRARCAVSSARGFSDARIAALLGVGENTVRTHRLRLGLHPGIQADRFLCGRVSRRHRLHVFDLRGGVRVRAERPAEDRRARRRSQPDRAGHRVRPTAACRPRSRCARPATRASWSTATRKPYRPISIRPIASTSSR